MSLERRCLWQRRPRRAIGGHERACDLVLLQVGLVVHLGQKAVHEDDVGLPGDALDVGIEPDRGAGDRGPEFRQAGLGHVQAEQVGRFHPGVADVAPGADEHIVRGLPVRAQPGEGMEIGQDLALLSVAELNERISLLKEEIARLEADIAKKEAKRNAADAFFRKS